MLLYLMTMKYWNSKNLLYFIKDNNAYIPRCYYLHLPPSCIMIFAGYKNSSNMKNEMLQI